jgi:hypothetical protein
MYSLPKRASSAILTVIATQSASGTTVPKSFISEARIEQLELAVDENTLHKTPIIPGRAIV